MTRIIQWSNSESTPSKFLVSSASDLRLCEYVHASSNNGGSRVQRKPHQVKVIAVCSDLPAFKVRMKICVGAKLEVRFMVSDKHTAVL